MIPSKFLVRFQNCTQRYLNLLQNELPVLPTKIRRPVFKSFLDNYNFKKYYIFLQLKSDEIIPPKVFCHLQFNSVPHSFATMYTFSIPLVIQFLFFFFKM